jgi:hypothetical protein
VMSWPRGTTFPIMISLMYRHISDDPA